MVTHPGTNWVWRSTTTLIEANALPLSQTANRQLCSHISLVANSLPRKTVKEFLKSANISQSYEWISTVYSTNVHTYSRRDKTSYHRCEGNCGENNRNLFEICLQFCKVSMKSRLLRTMDTSVRCVVRKVTSQQRVNRNKPSLPSAQAVPASVGACVTTASSWR